MTGTNVKDYGKSCEDVLKRKNISISEELAYKLSEERIRELEEEYKGRPYGDVQLNARLVYIPNE